MKKILSAMTVALAMTSMAPAENFEKMTTEMFSPVVKLEVKDEKSGRTEGFCTGTLIYSERSRETGLVETYGITAKHCGERGNAVDVITYTYNDNLIEQKNTHWLATIDSTSYASDLAIFKLRDKTNVFDNIAKIASEDTKPYFGMKIDSVSYPLAQNLTWTEGRLGFVQEPVFCGLSTSCQFYRATPAIESGSSGSGLFAKIDGEYQIIGILTGSYRLNTFMNFYTPLPEIRKYIDRVKLSWATVKETESDTDKKKESFR